MLQDGPGFVLFDTLRHHVQDVMHHRSTQLQIKVGLNTLFGHCLGYALGVTSYRGHKKELLLKLEWFLTRNHLTLCIKQLAAKLLNVEQCIYLQTAWPADFPATSPTVE